MPDKIMVNNIILSQLHNDKDFIKKHSCTNCTAVSTESIIICRLIQLYSIESSLIIITD